MAPDPHTVAAAALAGPWQLEPLTERLAEHGKWRSPEEIGDVVAILLGRWRARPRRPFERVVTEVEGLLAARPGTRPPDLEPDVPIWRWPVQQWTDLDALALGLDLRDGELEWFADPGGWLRRTPAGPLHHYRRRWVTARSGTPRLLESPGPRLQELQRRVGRHVLARIPVHDAAHGYVRGRSPATLAALHAGRAMVVKVDLEGFFGHVTGERLAGLMRIAGYPPAVAAALAGLLVTATPEPVLRSAPAAEGAWEARRRLLDRLAAPHLPQGAPTSPAAANLLAFRLDRRLAGLAAALGATYGRYADDLVFSAATLPASGLITRIGRIAEEEGFRLHATKTRVLPSHHRQRVTGLVVNAEPGAARREYDALRALLHNCARTGPDEQNTAEHPAFREHLLGRIAWVSTGRPRRADRLRALFDAIRWP
ncbi:reverse transcriptase family protein [Pseudonocardia sp. TRM90224]|uniref:reverse transcriptase family protein n=1 Tax=Pseudonocardia sp. TRM90224 TaxID=2812678 RepID=UPI001E3712C0|nr:reverse transcriptase family protein [Pseudonocardia sp. TRM90224]